MILREGTIVDATFIAAPPSTKNKAKARDPEMHQAKKGNNWHFGMKAHIGVDAKSGLVHAVIGTAANVSDVSQTHALVHGEESDVFGDAGYQGVEKRPENQAPRLIGISHEARQAQGAAKGCDGKAMERFEKLKASIRAKVEHLFHVLKNLFKLQDALPRSAKNVAQLFRCSV